jgi:predicted ATPase
MDRHQDDTKAKLSEIRISGYKSISARYPLSLSLKDINILLGANGAGKSNIISFFQMVSYMMSGAFTTYVGNQGTAQVLLNYGSSITRQIDGELTFTIGDSEDKYLFSLSYATPDRLNISSERIEWKKGAQEPFSRDLAVQLVESALTTETDRTSRTIRRIVSGCKVYQFNDSSYTGAIRQSSHIDQSDYLRSDGGNLAAILHRLRQEYADRYYIITSSIRYILPAFDDFYLEPNKAGYVMLKWRDRSADDYIFLPQQFSDGTIRFIALATLLTLPPEMMPPLIIIDEPELGLHPAAIEQLGEMIREAAEHTQVIVATQSPMLMDQFEPEDIIVVENDEKGGHTTTRRLDDKELRLWLGDYTLSELWNKNVLGGRP